MDNNYSINKKYESKLNNIKSIYFIKQLLDNLKKHKSLEIIKYNKNMQNRLGISITNYQEYSQLYTPIEIELIPSKNKYGKFINITKDLISNYYHIYFNDAKDEIRRTYINENNKVTKIKIIIEPDIKSFKNLFKECECIESIYFKKFYRKNITDISYMFAECHSLKKIKLSNFKTNSVINMAAMFFGCADLKKLDISNFDIDKVNDMSFMFLGCKSLEELILPDICLNNEIDMTWMFHACSDELQKKVIAQNEYIKEEAFN